MHSRSVFVLFVLTKFRGRLHVNISLVLFFAGLIFFAFVCVRSARRTFSVMAPALNAQQVYIVPLEVHHRSLQLRSLLNVGLPPY
jgi:hypothetical protein